MEEIMDEGPDVTIKPPPSDELPHTPSMPLRSSVTPVLGSNDDVNTHDGTGNGEDGHDVAGTHSSHDAPESKPAHCQGLGKRSRELIQVIQKLGTLNINATLPSLPKFVVVGDQSHGKSSIIEAVCDISLPRSEGTCTRCPFQITTTSKRTDTNEPWTCRISLVITHEYDAITRKDAQYPGWKEAATQTSRYVMTIKKKHLLDDALRAAQVAILNPHMNPDDIIAASDLNIKSIASFSPNVISLYIEAADLPEMSLYDLPGAINIAPRAGEQHLVKFVENLIKTYVRDEQALILLAAGANQDVDTSTAFKFVLQSKAGFRCAGVMTKPDLCTKRPDQLRQILEEHEFQLGGGWFVVKLLSQQELDDGVLNSDARNREQAFFSSQEPWCKTLEDFACRFGVPKLQEFLSKKLTEHIHNALPEITSRVARRLNEVRTQLAAFPEQAKAPCLIVVNEIGAIYAAVCEQLQGGAPDNKFRKNYYGLLRDLGRRLRKEAEPHVVYSTPGYVQPAFCVDSDDEDEGPTPASTPSKSRKASDIPTPSKARKGNDGAKILTPTTNRQTRPLRTPTKPEAVIGRAEFKLDEVRVRLEAGSNSGIPHQINAKVTECMALDCLRGWDALFAAAMKQAQALLKKILNEVIETNLARRRQTKLFTATIEATGALLSELFAHQHNELAHALKCETHSALTVVSDVFKEKTKFMSDDLHKKRLQKRLEEFLDTQESQGSSRPTKPAERKKKLEDPNWVAANLGQDPYETEVTLLATPLAYYDLASVRFLDTVAKQWEYNVLQTLRVRLYSHLFEVLKASDTDFCTELLAEDPRREAARRDLLREEERLVTAMAELDGLRADEDGDEAMV